MPTFYFDSIINPISAYKVERNKRAISTEVSYLTNEDLEEFEMPENFCAFLDEDPLCNKSTSNGIALLWAPAPFNLRSGRTRRAFDVPLVCSWFKEKCPAGYPVKVGKLQLIYIYFFIFFL